MHKLQVRKVKSNVNIKNAHKEALSSILPSSSLQMTIDEKQQTNMIDNQIDLLKDEELSLSNQLNTVSALLSELEKTDTDMKLHEDQLIECRSIELKELNDKSNNEIAKFENEKKEVEEKLNHIENLSRIFQRQIESILATKEETIHKFELVEKSLRDFVKKSTKDIQKKSKELENFKNAVLIRRQSDAEAINNYRHYKSELSLSLQERVVVRKSLEEKLNLHKMSDINITVDSKEGVKDSKVTE